METAFSRSLKSNRLLLNAMLRMDLNDDLVTRPFQALGLVGLVLYVEGMASGNQIGESILRPLLRCPQTLTGRAALETAARQIIEAAELKLETNPGKAVGEMLRGQCLVLLDTAAAALVVDVRGYVRRGVSTPQTENVVIGPHESFTEALRDNLTLMHRLLPTPAFLCRMTQVGDQIATPVALCYLDGVCPSETVQEIRRRLDGCAVDHVLTLSMLNQLLEDDPWAPLPQAVLTERPDRVASFLLEGQAVLLMEGSPYGLCLPMCLWHLFHAPDDSYMRWQYGTFMRLVRLAGAVLALLLPGVFLSAVLFHPIALPMSLLTNIIQSRSVVSISLFGEALLMITVFNLINEASARIPGLLGSSFGLVSALILGTAAVDAGLVSPMLLIVVALSGLGSYALPSYPLSFAVRIGQFLLTLAGGLIGMPGVCLLLVLFVIRVAGMDSMGRPYLAPRTPFRVHNPDLAIRAPVFRQRLRSWLADSFHMLRARGPMRRFEKGGRK